MHDESVAAPLTPSRSSPETREAPVPRADVMTLVVTQAFGPGGDNLVGYSDVRYSGHPAITVLVRTPEGREGLVHLSPIHGDSRKQGFTDIAPGTRCTLMCPVTRRPLENLGAVDDGSGAVYHALYLTPRLLSGHAIAISDIWGHYNSRIVDDEAVISFWAH
ncbi:MAG: hypothetical protein ABW123_26205 [Cystobacter sp.]